MVHKTSPEVGKNSCTPALLLQTSRYAKRVSKRDPNSLGNYRRKNALQLRLRLRATRLCYRAAGTLQKFDNRTESPAIFIHFFMYT